jgi:capsular polysaccharide transport system permease protein
VADPEVLARRRRARAARAALKAVESPSAAAQPAPDPRPDPRPEHRPDPRPDAPPRPEPQRPRRPARPGETGIAPEPAPESAIEPARIRPRHQVLVASFLALVMLPVVATAVYLWFWAAPEYHSETAFSVRSEEMGSAAAGILGAITQIGGGSASDTDVLYDYIRSQAIVEAIGARLDLRAIYNRAPEDPVFTLGDDPTIEALVEHWRRMVRVSLESREGIIDVRTYAFTPEDAQKIAQAVLAESNRLVNALSDQARQDAVRFAADELALAEAHLREVRANLANFRRDHRFVDPRADVSGQAGLLNGLENELAKAMVERDMLLTYADPKDQRVQQIDRRIAAVRARIEDERGSLAVGGVAGSMPEVVGDYEELEVDLEIARTAYTHALAGRAAAEAMAQRQARYLVPHIQPTRAETALYPRKVLITGLAALFLTLGWSVVMLVYYNVRDNR